MLGVTGMVVGILNSYDRFGVFAIAPALLERRDHRRARRVRARCSPRRTRSTPTRSGSWSGPWSSSRSAPSTSATPRSGSLRVLRLAHRRDVRRVLLLMLPVTISLGLINFNLVINSIFGTLVSDRAPAAIDKAFRIYMLPQGIFSVAVTTVLFPTLARFAARARLRRPAGDDGERDAPDRPPADPGGGGDPGPLGADDPARLRARRVRRRADRAGRDGAVLVRLLAARSTASSCCSPGPSSASSGPGCRPRSRR